MQIEAHGFDHRSIIELKYYAQDYLVSPAVSHLVPLNHPPGQGAELLGAGTRGSSCAFAFRDDFVKQVECYL